MDSLIVETALNNVSEAGLTAIAQFLIAAIEFLGPTLVAWMTWETNIDRMRDRNRKSVEEFDFIVVGSGSAGAIVANRLSETHNVLLLETGGTPNAWLRVPVLTYLLHGQAPIDWKWTTVPQKHSSFGLNNNVNFWPGGKALGGSSNINGMIDYRGNVQGFDTLANVSGNPIWKMENMLNVFKNLEDYHGYFDDGISHGKNGHLAIEKSHLHLVTKQFLKAGEELGYKIRDPNADGPITDGFGPMDFYLKNGRRWSAYHGYLRDIMGERKTLTVKKFATVTKVLIDENNQAYGVEYFQHGRSKIARCTKEVILSAGSIQSPKLLMLSGIGPKKHLQELGIPLKSDLPVGQNLQDKYGALVGPFLSATNTSFLRDRDGNTRTVSEWLVNGTGPIACSRSEATFSVSSSMAKPGFTDMHSYFLAYSVDTRFRADFTRAFNFKPAILDHFVRVQGRDAFMQMVTLNQIEGTGTLRLRNKDPFSQPLIDPKYLKNPRDMKILVEAIKLSVALVDDTQSFRELNASLLATPLPGCEEYEFKSNSYWECYARSLTITAYKYSGTAPIGKDRSDPEAVVDSELRVFGVKGLRVVDASVLQVRQLSVNHVSVQGTAEVASQLIKDYWRSPFSVVKKPSSNAERFNNNL